ncbi:polysaccharide deacetylase family protein [Bacillus seohaeanensis]|uniref:Polysaccharide deacetylase family protein n=1 Tax=Bacillus seohaeanensis TaxID=284580 RepID=A0ABW5RKR3_9BACI
MRKLTIIIFLLIASFFTLDYHSKASALYVKANSDVQLYDTIAGDTVRVGTLLSGQSMKLINEDEQYYFIHFGNGTAFIKKSGKVEVSGKSPSTTSTQNSKKLNKVIITTRQTVVYDSVKESKKAFAILNRNVRYPIISEEENWYTISLGNKVGYIYKENTKVDSGVPVLMYHHMLRDEENVRFRDNNMVISVESFEEQMQYLHKQGYRTILLQELEKYLNSQQNLVGKIAVITFDDGMLSSEKYAYPILKKFDFKATHFLIGYRTRDKNVSFHPDSLQYFSFNTMKETNDIFDFQHHTYNMHVRDRETMLPFLIFKSFEEVQTDLLRGKKRIGEHHQGEDAVKYLAYPWGQFDQKTIEAAKATGIKLAFTTETGYVKIGDSPYQLKRQGVGPRHSLKDFIMKVNGSY